MFCEVRCDFRAISMTHLPMHPLSQAQKIAVLLCHCSGLSSLEIGFHFNRTPRYVNMIIHAMKQQNLDLIEALGIHESVMMIHEHNKQEQSQNLCEEESRDQSVPPNWQLAVDARKIERLKEKIHKLQLKNVRQKDLYEQLKMKYNEFLTAERHEEVVTTQALPDILQELLNLSGVEKNRRRYSEAFYRFSYIFFTLSPRAYRYVRKVLVLPSKTSLWRHFSPAVKSMQRSLTELDSTYELLEGYLETRNPECDRMVATIGVDAFAFRLFLRQIASISTIKEALAADKIHDLGPLLEDRNLIRAINDLEEDDVVGDDVNMTTLEPQAPRAIEKLFDVYNHCFIYVLIPLDNSMPPLPLHLSPSSSGAARPQHLQIMHDLTKLCENYNIEVVYSSADGDAGWNIKFHEMFEIIMPHIDKRLPDMAGDIRKECWNNGIHMATTDLLHFLKRARGRYIDNTISVCVNEISKTNYACACKVLRVGLALSDKSQLGRMRDFYPLELFTVKNVIKLIECKCFADAFYFFPFALLLLVIRVPFFRSDFRLHLLETAFVLFRHVYYDVLASTQKKADEDDSSEQEKGDCDEQEKGDCDEQEKGDCDEKERVVQRPRGGYRLVTFAELGALERIICTIVSYASAFQTHPATLRTDALGTHIVEQKIGQARHGMDNRWSRILSVLTQSVLRSVMLGIDGIELHSPGRVKTAGCCLDGDADFYIENFDPLFVSQVFTHMPFKSARLADDFEESLSVVLSWLKMIDGVMSVRESEIAQVWLPSPAANSGIMARLLRSQINTISPESVSL